MRDRSAQAAGPTSAPGGSMWLVALVAALALLAASVQLGAGLPAPWGMR